MRDDDFTDLLAYAADGSVDGRLDSAPLVVPLQVRDVVLDPAFARRRDALLRTVPVHDLVDRAERADSGLTGFDVRALVLAAFDAVIARQGFPDRATPADVLTLLTGIASVQNPGATAAACAAIAEHVLDGLTNRRQRERQFTPSAIVYAEDAHGRISAQAVPRPFWLLREAEDPHTGGIYLEASVDAVNALVGGLDIPIEDQQTAIETVLERQLARGELDAAHLTALRARRLTAGYLIQIEELLAETDRYLPGTDWAVLGPRLISDALEHVGECLTREGRLLEHVAAGRSDQTDPDENSERRARISEALTKLLGESRHLHTALMERLIGARGRFLDAQNQQMFRPVLSTINFDLRADLLEPVLGLHMTDAERVADAYLRGVLGPVTPTVLNWADFVDALIHPLAAERGTEAESDLDEVVFRPDPEPLVSAELLDATHAILSRISLPARLSTLLAACPDTGGSGANPSDLLVAASLRAFDNSARDHVLATVPGDWAAAERPVGHSRRPDHAVDMDGGRGVHLLDVLGPDAACLADEVLLNRGAMRGHDLIVCVDRDQADAIVVGELPAPPPSPLPDHLTDPSRRDAGNGSKIRLTGEGGL